MEQYIIKGGNPLVGEVEIGGAKNAALGILAAAIMTDETIVIENLPDVQDINVLLEAISQIGAKVERVNRNKVKINGSMIGDFSVDYEFIKKIRASYYLLGALLGKYKRAEVPLPGGCNIGSRPIDLHLKGFKALGAKVSIRNGSIIAEADRLVGNHIFLDTVSVGATINIMMAAAMAEGRTTLENAAREPHVVDVANFLNSMGANIKGAGTDVIRIRGVESLHRTEYSIIPDQIEAGTFMFAAAATKGDVMVKNVIPKHLEATTAKLVEIGCEVEEFDDAVRVVASKRLRNTNIKTLPYPGYPTDMQPQIGVTLAIASGTSIVTESIFENRFKYVDELARMGASVKVEGREPHVVDVANFLNSMGANIKGAGTDVIRIRGVESLHRTEYSIIPDQIEAGTFMFAAAATKGDVMVKNVIPKHLEATTAKLVEIGCEVEEFDDAVRVVASKRLRNTNIKTLPYPGYPTDMQPQIGVTLAIASGTSIVTESIFENRFKYVDELARMGASVKVEGNTAIITGVDKLTGARVSAPDLRAGAALVIAGLAAEGITIVDDIVYIQRGYEAFEEKLRGLGAEIERVATEKDIRKFKLRVG